MMWNQDMEHRIYTAFTHDYQKYCLETIWDAVAERPWRWIGSSSESYRLFHPCRQILGVLITKAQSWPSFN
jgi:hypothetical protein